MAAQVLLFEDAKEAKARLELALPQHHVEGYWTQFKLFLRGQLSKKQWDLDAERYLGKPNVYLHNEFVKAVIANSIPAAPQRPLSESKRRKVDEQTEDHVPRTRPKVIVPHDRDQIPKEQFSLLSDESVYSSLDAAALRALAFVIVSEHHMEGMTDEAFYLLEQSLEWFLKSLLEEALIMKMASSDPEPTPDPSSSSSSSLRVVHSADLFAATFARPSLLGPLRFQFRERFVSNAAQTFS